MTAIIAQLGAILLQLGAISALILVAPVLYGLVVAMRRWWLVVAAAIALLLAIAFVSANPALIAAVEQLPGTMRPDTSGYLTFAIAYVMLAMIVRLATLRLEWRGWQRRTVKDIHVLAFLLPTLGGFAAAYTAIA